MAPIPPVSVDNYRAPPSVAAYVAHRIVRGDLPGIPYLQQPKPDDPGLQLINATVRTLFSPAHLRVTPQERARAEEHARMSKGIEPSVKRLQQHCGDATELIDAEERKLVEEAVAPVHTLADKLLTADPSTYPFTPFGREDALVLAAARWFKHTYFRWADPLTCHACQGSTQYKGQGMPTRDDRAGGAERVEIHVCTVCGAERRFPRYNKVKALMTSREGRCGEFAQLFYIFLLVLGLDARYVWNSEDHVWTEYWSPAQQHWVHVDSCEAETGKPLLYDRGWGKMQRWCLAFGVHGAEDVTRAYVDDWDACLARRMQATEDGRGISEEWLREVLLAVTVRCRAHIPIGQRAELSKMDASQAAWMADEPRRHAEAERAGLKGKGRESGTKEWVEARGEGGADEEGGKPAEA